MSQCETHYQPPLYTFKLSEMILPQKGPLGLIQCHPIIERFHLSSQCDSQSA